MSYSIKAIIFLSAGLLSCSSPLFALETAAIEAVAKKAVLEPADLAVIDQFVAAGVQELLNTTDFSNVGKLREAILARVHSTQGSADVQYYPQFVAAAEKSVAKAIDDARKIPDPNVQTSITINLLILLYNVSDAKLVPVAFKALDSQSEPVRYWAVQVAANPKIVEQINNGKLSISQIDAIIDPLLARLKTETSPEILLQIAQLGASANLPQAKNLLLQVADIRIKGYEEWKVNYIPLDGLISKLLADTITAQSGGASEAASRFGQLLSHVILMYAKGIKDFTAAEKAQLGEVLTQVESRILTKLSGVPQSGIKRAVEKENTQALLAEYKDLFGDGMTPGRLTSVLKAEYVQADGSKGTLPRPLPDKTK